MSRNLQLLLGTLVLSALPAHAAGIVISPIQLGLVGAPGATVSGVINVSSPRVQDNRIRVTFGDYVVDDLGNRTEVAGSAAGTRSCSKWLDVDQEQFVSPERGSVPVVITAHIPRDASGSYWAAASFEVLPKPPSLDPAKRSEHAVAIQMVPKINVPVIVTVQGTETYEVKVRTIAAKRTRDGLETAVVVENSGNAAVVLSGAIALERTTSDVPEEIASKDVDSVTSYPGSSRVLKVILPRSDRADGVDVHVYLRYGPGKNQGVEASSPLSSILATESAGRGASL